MEYGNLLMNVFESDFSAVFVVGACGQGDVAKLKKRYGRHKLG